MLRDKKEGDSGESLFESFLKRKGMKVRPTTNEENRLQKIDYVGVLNDKVYKFDVKVKDEDHVWIEIQNNWAYPGSIYGNSTHFAIIYRNTNIVGIMKTSDLRQFVVDNVDPVFTDKTGKDVPYHCFYRRVNRQDITTKTNRKFLKLTIPSYKEYLIQDI